LKLYPKYFIRSR